MDATGILTENSQVELVEGELINRTNGALPKQGRFYQTVIREGIWVWEAGRPSWPPEPRQPTISKAPRHLPRRV
jgi:hypothetical protein